MAFQNMHPLRGTASNAEKSLKRSACLVFFFEDEGLRCTNYLTGITLASTPILVAVLNFFDRWRESKEIKLLLRGYSGMSVRSTIRQLLDNTLLIEQGSAQAFFSLCEQTCLSLRCPIAG